MNSPTKPRTVVAAALGECVHVAGVINFLRLAETAGWRTVFLGPSVSVERVLEVLDRERVTVAAALGIRARTALEWLKMAYDATGDDLYEAIHNQPGYYGIKAPPTINHRYITEDVPASLVPIAALGERYGVSVRGIDSIIRLACIIHRTDYWRRGRTLKRMGIEGMSVSEVIRYVMEGVLP